MSLPRSRSEFPSSSRSVSASMHGAVAAFKNTDKDSTYLEDVMKKVRDHPNFKDLSSAGIKQQAKKLTSTELMKEYFSDYFTFAQDNILQVTSMTPAPTTEASRHEATAANSTNVGINTSDIDSEEATTVESTFSHVQNVAAFPVKLYLTSFPSDKNMNTDNTFASTLETIYGPMQASLQIGYTMIEWTSHGLVVPHFNIPSEAVIKTDITRSLKIASELRQKAREYKSSRRGTVTGEVDLMFEISKSISAVVEAVIQVIVSWNRYKYFHAYHANSQHFVQNIIAVLGIEELPLPSQNLSAYVGRLKTEFQSNGHKSFKSHAELDSYVGQTIGKLSTSEMEYLLTEYYRFHVTSRAGAIHGDGEWRCKERDCQVQRLEREIDGKELLITSLRLT